MKVVVNDKKEIHLPGKTYSAGEVVEVPDKAALRYLAQGAVERYETKVVCEVPLPDAGAAEPLSALPAGQASTGVTVNLCVSGAPDRETANQIARKRGRPRKASSQ